MSEADALRGFLGKWEAQWPEWRVAEAFVPVPQRELAQAWFALREELAEAAWGGEDARPGDAKLSWWAEELDGWSRGVTASASAPQPSGRSPSPRYPHNATTERIPAARAASMSRWSSPT